MQNIKSKSINTWKDYWKSHNNNINLNSHRMTSYQIPVYLIIKRFIKNKKLTSILSAGSGLDLISYNLQVNCTNHLKITLLDISKEVLGLNRIIFSNRRLDAKYVEGDVFAMPFSDNSFDLIFNTGLLEHFITSNQVKIVTESMRVLKPGGYLITANPSDKGVIYKFGMRVAKQNQKWPFGREVPINSLKFMKDKIATVASVKEIQKDFLTQLNFLSYVHPALKWLTLPFRVLGRWPIILSIYDRLFTRLLGTYLLISIIRKQI